MRNYFSSLPRRIRRSWQDMLFAVGNGPWSILLAAIVVVLVILIVIGLCYGVVWSVTWITMLAWNNFAHGVLGAQAITQWQAFWMLLLFSIIGSYFSRHTSRTVVIRRTPRRW